MEYTINIGGRLLDLSEPKVMGILNVTPDSFYAGSRQQTREGIAARCRQIVAEGGAIIDVGACSTRPDAAPVDEAEEMSRLRTALAVIRSEQPGAALSVDTFRPSVARMAVEEFGVNIINDVGTPSAMEQRSDRNEMFRMVARLGVPYILMCAHARIRETLLTFAREVQQLRDYGQKDIVLDPGFGFGKTIDENYQLLNRLEQLQVMELPLLVGVSRKSMVTRVLGNTPGEALNGTTALNMVALMKGAAILRVHDVRQAVECVRLYEHVRAATPQYSTHHHQ